MLPLGRLLAGATLAAIVCTTLAVSLRAQTATATLAGVVADETDAAIPNVSLTLVNFDTAIERRATTSGNGSFSFPFVPPGRYTLTAVRDGFAPAELRDVVLRVGDALTLRLILKIGAVSDAVVVQGKARPVSRSGAVATTVDRAFIENQPLNGRSFQTLIGLAPGVVFTPAGVTTLGQFSINGQRANANYFTVDGVSANFGVATSTALYETGGGGVPSLSTQGGTNALTSVDAVQEFQIQTSSYAPEFGRQPGGQVSIVTRSGSNGLHGSLFEYFRDDALDATNWFANRNGLAKTALRQHDAGGVLGGPIVTNRAFFFASYEGLRLDQPIVTGPEAVPSVAARGRATGLVRDMLNGFPIDGATPVAGDPDTALFVGTFSNPSSLDSTSVRIDTVLRAGWRLFGRIQHAPSDTRVRANFGSASSIAVTTQRTTAATAGLTLPLSARTLVDIRVNASRSLARVENDVDDFGGAVAPPASAFFPAFTDPSRGLSLLQVGTNTLRLGVSQENRQRQVNVVGAVTSTRGSHEMKAGLDYRRLTPIADQGEYTRLINFSSVTQALGGQLNNALVARADIDLFPVFHNLSMFAQDTWRTTPRLSLTFGVRYELNPAPDDADGHLPLTVTGLDTPSLQLAPAGTRLYETTYGNLAPRVGGAYIVDEDQRTVIRGGYGVYYDLGYAFTGSALVPSSFPYGNTVTQTNLPLSSPFVSAPAPAATVQSPYPALFAYAPDYALPYTLHSNFGVEHRLGGYVASATYVGAAGRRLGRAEVVLNPSPDFTRLNVVRNEGRSDYRALQLQVQRPYANGWQALVSYTLAESLDNVSDESISSYQAALARYDPARDRGPSNFDVRHSVTGALGYDLPAPAAGLGRALLGGFGVDAILRARSALPVNVTLGSDVLGLGTATVARPDVVPNVPLSVDDATAPGGRRLNRAAFALPAPGVQGTLERNALRGFAFTQVDLSLRRRLSVSTRAAVLLRIDAFNLFNAPNFANPEGRLNNASFGLSTQTLGTSLGSGGVGLSPLYQVGGPRSLQLSAKVTF